MTISTDSLVEATGSWEPNLHPRDRQGQFRDVLGKIKALNVGEFLDLAPEIQGAHNIRSAYVWRTKDGWEIRGMSNRAPSNWGVKVSAEDLAVRASAFDDALKAMDFDTPFPDVKRCSCGCGAPQPGKGDYLPGHDARHKSQLVTLHHMGDERATRLLDQKGWTKFADKTPEAKKPKLQPHAPEDYRAANGTVEANGKLMGTYMKHADGSFEINSASGTRIAKLSGPVGEREIAQRVADWHAKQPNGPATHVVTAVDDKGRRVDIMTPETHSAALDRVEKAKAAGLQYKNNSKAMTSEVQAWDNPNSKLQPGELKQKLGGFDTKDTSTHATIENWSPHQVALARAHSKMYGDEVAKYEASAKEHDGKPVYGPFFNRMHEQAVAAKSEIDKALAIYDRAKPRKDFEKAQAADKVSTAAGEALKAGSAADNLKSFKAMSDREFLTRLNAINHQNQRGSLEMEIAREFGVSEKEARIKLRELVDKNHVAINTLMGTRGATWVPTQKARLAGLVGPHSADHVNLTAVNDGGHKIVETYKVGDPKMDVRAKELKDKGYKIGTDTVATGVKQAPPSSSSVSSAAVAERTTTSPGGDHRSVGRILADRTVHKRYTHTLPSGETVTRKSYNPYTHVGLFRHSKDDTLGIAGWSGSAANAEKAISRLGRAPQGEYKVEKIHKTERYDPVTKKWHVIDGSSTPKA